MEKKRIDVFHEIEFLGNILAEVESIGRRRSITALFRKGDHASAQLHPHVVQGETGPVEVADLIFEDGAVTRRIRYAWFQFS